MSRRILLLFCVVFEVWSSAIGVKSSSNITQCNKNDSACHTKNALTLYKLSVQGDPELGIESLDPMYQSLMEGNLAIITYKLYNSTVKGLGGCDVTNTKINFGKSTFSFRLVCPFIEMFGLYEVSGRLIVLPIEGKGDYKVECKDYHIFVDTDIKISEGKDGKRYMSFKSFRVNADLRGGMSVDLKNLFNGQQKKLAETVLRFANDNWSPVSKELQGPVFGANIRKLIKNFNKYMKHVPVDMLIVQ